MFLSSLLSVSEHATNIVKWISVGAIGLLLVLIAVISAFNKKKRNTKQIAFAGICVCMSFILALIKFSPIQYGGSITLASFVPILIYAYVYGAIDGFIVGLIHGLLNFVEDPYILTPATFIFDYLLAFMSVGVMGFFGKMARKEKGCMPIVLGCVAVFSLRFASHLVSGMIFFINNSVWVSLPDWAMGNAFAYSFIYQCIYVPLDAVIATACLIALCKTGGLDRLAKIMRPKRKASDKTVVSTNNEA